MKKHLSLLSALCCALMVMAAKPTVESTTKSAPAQQPSEEITRTDSIIQVFMDTTYTYTTTTRKVEVAQEESDEFTRKGHYLQALIGAGYGTMGYSLQDLTDGLRNASNNGGGNGLIQLNYAYYFHENVGVMVGLQFEHMNSYTVLNGTKTWEGQGDSDYGPTPTGTGAGNGELYTHTVVMNNWTEKQVSYLLGLPVGLQFQWPIATLSSVQHRNNQLRMYADVGAKVNYLVAQRFNLVSGSISHTGVYDKWGLVLDEGLEDRDYYTETIGESKGWTTDKNNLSLKNISVDGMVDLGFMIPLQEHLDLMVGLYANYTFNNLRDGEGKEIGWRNDEETGYRQHTFMESYDGIIATDYVKAVRPWDVGVKVGISWNAPAKKPKQYEQQVLCDTTMQLSRREVAKPVEIPVAAQKINEIMKKSVIWFPFDSDKPNLQPADVIDKIAAVLLEHPEQMVLVYGHASKEGSMDYNQRLSERRSSAIVKLLKQKGVPAKQMVSKGFSFTQQYDDSENPYHNIALDRRVEIIPVFEEDRIQ